VSNVLTACRRTARTGSRSRGQAHQGILVAQGALHRLHGACAEARAQEAEGGGANDRRLGRVFGELRQRALCMG
jgi:hypothetical protein